MSWPRLFIFFTPLLPYLSSHNNKDILLVSTISMDKSRHKNVLLDQDYSKCCSLPSSINITWELV